MNKSSKYNNDESTSCSMIHQNSEQLKSCNKTKIINLTRAENNLCYPSNSFHNSADSPVSKIN